MKTIPVTCAIIIHQEKVLAARRGESMDLPEKWEFPGGKVDEDESPEQCLIREIKEELNMEIEILFELASVQYSYPTKTIQLLPFCANWIGGKIKLLEHSEIRWLGKNELLSLDWAPADVPLVHELFEKWVKLVDQNES
jgi:8-oxo-dGTP diphosphatase